MYHKLLAKQIEKLLPPAYHDDEVMKAFLSKISSTYTTFERDKEISEHAFAVSEKEYQEVTSSLRRQDEIRQQSFIKLKNAILSLDASANFDSSDDDLIHVISYLETEIQKKKELQEELINAKEVAEKASAAKSYFLANMSHEIRTPLNGIAGMIELALSTQLTPEQQRYLEIVKSSSDILMNVINDILDFSKIDAGKLDLHPYAFSLRNDIARGLKTIGLKAYEKELEFVVRIESSVPDLLVGDALRIQQIILNLLNNAVKFTEKGQVIFDVQTVKKEEQMVHLHFSVQDTGIGIEEDKLQGIFGEFIQADNSANRKFTGTGLGLAISKKLVEMMGGRIWVESRLGEGSTFHFTLPVEMQAGAEQPRFVANEKLQQTTVLVAEGNNTHRSYTIQMLKHFGIKCLGFAGGEELLKELLQAADRKEPYQIVLLDTNLEGNFSGIEVARLIRENEKLATTKIFITSMSHMAYDRELLSRLGVSDFFTKPFSHSDLLDAVQNALSDQHTLTSTARPRQQLEAEQEKQSSQRVLLVEDNLVNQEVACSMLRSLGHHVVIAANGGEAVERVQKENFDVILMDVQMPVLNGYEATRKIRELDEKNGSRHFIVGLTANAMNGDRKKCIEAGMDDYLTKPVHLNALATAISKKSKPHQVNGSHRNSAVPAVDMVSLAGKLMGNRKQLERCIELLKRDAPASLQQLSEQLSKRNWKALKDECHGLKGMLLTMEMHSAARIASAIEQEALQKNSEAIVPMLVQLDKRIVESIEQMEQAATAEEAFR